MALYRLTALDPDRVDFSPSNVIQCAAHDIEGAIVITYPGDLDDRQIVQLRTLADYAFPGRRSIIISNRFEFLRLEEVAEPSPAIPPLR